MKYSAAPALLSWRKTGKGRPPTDGQAGSFSFPGSCLGMTLIRALPGLYPRIHLSPFSRKGNFGPEIGWIFIFRCDYRSWRFTGETEPNPSPYLSDELLRLQSRLWETLKPVRI